MSDCQTIFSTPGIPLQFVVSAKACLQTLSRLRFLGVLFYPPAIVPEPLDSSSSAARRRDAVNRQRAFTAFFPSTLPPIFLRRVSFPGIYRSEK